MPISILRYDVAWPNVDGRPKKGGSLMEKHQECYGKLFPSIESGESNVTHKGKVFSLRLERPGMAVTRREVGMDLRQWDECTGCPEFESCFKLSQGKITMELAVRNFAVFP
ncbi:MAG: hypothetical protein AB1898_17835 [Acidobacteriota bacterium]